MPRSRSASASRASTNSRLLRPAQKKKPPGDEPRGSIHAEVSSLAADLNTGSTTRRAGAGVTFGHHLHPQRIRTLVVGRGARLTQRIQTVLRRTGGCGGESGQMEDHPRAAIQFVHGEGHGRPFRRHFDLGTGSYVGTSGHSELLTIAAENEWRRRWSGRSAESTAKCATTGSGARTGHARAARSSGSYGSSAGGRGCAGTGCSAPGGTCTTGA